MEPYVGAALALIRSGEEPKNFLFPPEEAQECIDFLEEYPEAMKKSRLLGEKEAAKELKEKYEKVRNKMGFNDA